MTNKTNQHPGEYVRENVIPKGMSVTKAAKTLGIGRPALSNFLNSNSALSPEMAARLQTAFGADAEDLMGRQARHDTERRSNKRVVSATARPFVMPLFAATSSNIESWANTHSARDQVAVFLRVLIHSTCNGLKSIDFPGNDDAQRPGWDGRITAAEGNPWVPEGESGWEFGTAKSIERKATEDYAKRTAATIEVERKRTAFVFVTPRRWLSKESWISEKRLERKWREVYAWDASDLEQWLEQSIPAQVWFADKRGQNLRGVKSLERCWLEWCADCEPSFTKDAFREPMSIFGEKVISHLQGNAQKPLRVVADSRLEALAFIAAALEESRTGGIAPLKDSLVIFTKPGVLSGHLARSPGFIPVIADSKVEVELAQSGSQLNALVVDHKTSVKHQSDISLEPLSRQGFEQALASMGLEQDDIKRLDRESGRSLTVLRRRLAQGEAIREPNWSQKEGLGSSLAPMAFAGAWVRSNSADRHLMGELAGCNYDAFEDNFTRLLTLEDPPVWSVGDYCGVVSKIDAQYGVARWVSVSVVDRFLEVSEFVLSERDPALGLPEEERWLASLHGKERNISSPLRKGIAESLVLLAIHGERLFGNRMANLPEDSVAELIQRLLWPMDEDNLRSQSSNLPLYAEAAPEVFLEALEADIGCPESAVRTLMAPVSDDFFGRTDRVDLLWALELLAWRPEWLHRVVDLLANLAKMEPDDNLFDKPSESLKSIFRAWMPQTTADIKLRVAALEHLIKKHPEIAWRIAAAQFDPAQRTGGYTRKPIWRDYAVGHGEPAINERRAFVTRCIETCLQWPRHTRDTLADLIQSALSETWFLLTHLDKLGEAVIEWAGSASDEDRAWLCQRLRASLRWNLSRRFNGSKSEPNQDQLVSKAKRMLQSLEPDDPVWRHAWLFENEQVEGWHEELEEGGDYKARYKQIEAQRRKTTQEVWTASGENGVIRLAFTGNAPNVAGRSLAQVIKDQDKRVAFIAAVLRDGDALKSHRHRQLLTGFFHGVGAATTFSLVELRCSGHLDDAGVMLLCLAPFVREVWDRINAISETAANQYWAKVEPFQVCQSKEDRNYAVAQLLEAERAAAAWILGCVEWAHLESRHIFKILLNVRTASDYEQGWDKVGAYRVKSALEVLAKRRAVHQEELARLEFLYLDLLWIDDKGVPNLEREIETKPEMFCEAVMLAYRREDNDAQTERTERERNQADRASLLLRTLARIPGHDENGELCKDRLTKWIRRAQELCEANGRRRTGNHHIGQLLSNAPVGEDGVWPCEIVRSVLNDVMNEDIEKGFRIARMNSPHFKLRGKGGAQERELAEQYEEWAKAADYSHPKVATLLRKLASSYRKEGRHQDLEDNYRNRLGY